MNILVYTTFNSFAIDQLSVLELFVKMGHNVFFLSQSPEGDLHDKAKKIGVNVAGSKSKLKSGILFYIFNFLHFLVFVKKHKMDIVFAHLQPSGFIAGCAARFLNYRFYYVRHNTNEHILSGNRNAFLINYLANKLSKKIICPSMAVFDYLNRVEGIDNSKLIMLKYGYNFDHYLTYKCIGNSKSIRNYFHCDLLVISIARLVHTKRHIEMFNVISLLLASGVNVKFICLGEGPLRCSLENYIRIAGLSNSVHLIGSKKNIIDYIEASDIFLHLSVSEASNSAVKEAGICSKPVIVSRTVGDFEEYVIDGYNGILVNQLDPVTEAKEAIMKMHINPSMLLQIGRNLRTTILNNFDIHHVQKNYISLLNSDI
jgi:glycosyltransferase involved in cell wall biosynthesis